VRKNQQALHNCDLLQEDSRHNPRISTIVLFESKMKQEGVLENILAARAREAEAELLQKYPAEQVRPVILKLVNLMKNINQDAHKSMVFFVCPVAEKVIYFTYNPYLSNFNKTHTINPLKSI
jgi:hypothetical protein